MTQGINKVTLLGNLGSDTETIITADGVSITKFRMATNESYVNRDGQRVDRTEWHSVVGFGPRFKGLSTFLRKGHKVHVTGALRTRDYEDKDGVKRYTTEVRMEEVIALTPQSQSQSSSQAGPPPAEDE